MASMETNFALTDLISQYKTADEAFLKQLSTDRQTDPRSEWEAKEAAEMVVIRQPCQTLDEVRAKVRLALEDENFFDSIKDCTHGGEHVLRIFLHSLMGEPPVDNGEKSP
jgi:hypothetical protein